MKTTFLTLAVAVVHLAAFAQGKVTFGNDNHLIVVRNDASWLFLAGKNGGLAGLAAPQIGAPNDVMSFLTAQLWAGPSASSLTLRSTFNPAGLAGFPDGRLANAPVTLTGISGGATGFFQIRLFETSAGSYAQAANGNGYWHGSTAVFSGTAGGFAPTPLASMTNWTGPIILSVNLLYVPPTELVTVGRIGNEFRFSFNADAYRTYTVEYTDSLATANWVTLTNIPPFHSEMVQISDAVTVTNRFYRVRTP